MAESAFVFQGVAVIPITIESLFKRFHASQYAIAIALALTSGTVSAQTQPPAAPRFEIQAFVVEGNTLLPQSQIEKIVGPFTGKNRDFGDIQRALEALQDAYVQLGYNAVRVTVPEQDIRAGRVRLQVAEARIGRVRVTGNRFFNEANIRASVPVLKEGTSPNTRALGENAQLANENPAKQATVALEASEQPGQIDATIRVTDDNPSKYGVFVDNSGTAKTGYYRTGASYQHANVFNRDNVLNAQVITSPGHASDVKIFGAGYRVPVYGWQGAFDVIAGYSDVNSGTVQELFTVTGKGRVFGLRYTQILPRIDTYDQKLALGWDYRAYENNVVFVGTTESLVPDITVRPLSLTYTGRLSQVGRDASFYLSGSRNLPGGSNGDQAAFDKPGQRTGAQADYSIWRGGAVFSQILPQDHIFRAAANGQYTRFLLVPVEQFGMGGADSVRGYFERETANDIGYRFSLEGYTPDFGARLGSGWRARALVFTDLARGHDNVPVRGADNKLGSFGIGVRLNQGKALGARLDVARATQNAGTRESGDYRVHFAIGYSF